MSIIIKYFQLFSTLKYNVDYYDHEIRLIGYSLNKIKNDIKLFIGNKYGTESPIYIDTMYNSDIDVIKLKIKKTEMLEELENIKKFEFITTADEGKKIIFVLDFIELLRKKEDTDIAPLRFFLKKNQSLISEEMNLFIGEDLSKYID